MWHVWISDTRKGKVILESNCRTTLNVSQLQGIHVNGPAAVGVLMAVLADNDKSKEFSDKYITVPDNVFYVDVKWFDKE